MLDGRVIYFIYSEFKLDSLVLVPPLGGFPKLLQQQKRFCGFQSGGLSKARTVGREWLDRILPLDRDLQLFVTWMVMA